MGNAHPNIAPYQVFPTRDGHMVLAIGNDGQFARFCESAGHPEFASDERFRTNPARVQHRDVLVSFIAQWTVQRDTAQWVGLLESAGVPCSPILDIDQVLSHPQAAARGMVLPGDSPDAPPMVAAPVLLDGRRPVADLAPPALGAHEARWLHASS